MVLGKINEYGLANLFSAQIAIIPSHTLVLLL